MNIVILIGRLTKDPELRYTPSGHAVASFTLAVVREYSKEDEADFIPVVTWNKTAENCANYLEKGRLVAVEGRLQVRSYETDSGQKRWVTEVISNRVKFLQRKGNATKNEDQETVDFSEINLDDLPF